MKRNNMKNPHVNRYKFLNQIHRVVRGVGKRGVTKGQRGRERGGWEGGHLEVCMHACPAACMAVHE
jgi:hypothetical protein